MGYFVAIKNILLFVTILMDFGGTTPSEISLRQIVSDLTYMCNLNK